MNTIYDTVLWGASLRGIQKAVELKNQGQNVILLNKYGFPGGSITESLSCLLDRDFFDDVPGMAQAFQYIQNQRFGLLYESKEKVLIHPEAVKRAGWNLIRENNLDILFHVLPLNVVKKDDLISIRLFGREGEFEITTRRFEDYSDDSFLSNFLYQTGPDNPFVKINCFFTSVKVNMEAALGIYQSVSTDIGHFVSLPWEQVQRENIETYFNTVLDGLAVEAWKNYGVRMRIMPVFPGISNTGETSKEQSSPHRGNDS